MTMASAQSWPTHAGDPQHTNVSSVRAQAMRQILWSTPVDLAPQYSGSSLLMHYASPLATAKNTIIVTVKTGPRDGFKIEGRRAGNGNLVWTLFTDYSLPPHNWTPIASPTIAPDNSLYTPGAGGTVLRRADADAETSAVTRIAFFGNTLYENNKATFDENVKICTPLTHDSQGNIYFGFRVFGSNPANLVGGVAKITPSGQGSWVPVSVLAADDTIDRPAMSCAPALSNDESILYIGVRGAQTNNGYLVAAKTENLERLNSVKLMVPEESTTAYVLEDSTSMPTVGPDGDVYYGAWYFNNYRGFMLHFDASLNIVKTPSAFGWDNTPSIVPASMVPNYTGPSTYLLFQKYNNYLEASGGGMNEMAVLDPNQSELDPVSNKFLMKPVIKMLAPTPDPRGGFIEWCVNTGAVDPGTNSAIVNSEDGKCYRWDFTTNTLTEDVRLTAGLGEAYTSTIIGPDGLTYAMSNATLFAMWDNVRPSAIEGPDSLATGEEGTMTLKLTSRATGDGAHVSLRSSNPNVLKVPGSVFVRRGLRTIDFKARASNVLTDTVVRVTAVRYGHVTEKIITVRSARIAGLTAESTVLYAPGAAVAGDSTTGTVTVAGSIPAGSIVNLSTSNAQLTLGQTSVAVSNEQPSANFTIGSMSPVSTEFVANVIASIGTSQQLLAITVRPRTSLATLSVARASGFESQSIGGALGLNTTAPVGGVDVIFAPIDGTTVFKLPTSVKVPEGAQSAKFTVGLLACGPVAVTRSFQASFGGVTLTQSLTVKPVIVIGFSISPKTVIGGVTTKGTVVMSAKAGSAFPLTVGVVVNGTHVFIPANVVVPTGSDTAVFNIATDEVTSQTVRRVTVSRNDTSATASFTLTP